MGNVNVHVMYALYCSSYIFITQKLDVELLQLQKVWFFTHGQLLPLFALEPSDASRCVFLLSASYLRLSLCFYLSPPCARCEVFDEWPQLLFWMLHFQPSWLKQHVFEPLKCDSDKFVYRPLLSLIQYSFFFFALCQTAAKDSRLKTRINFLTALHKTYSRHLSLCHCNRGWGLLYILLPLPLQKNYQQC